MTENGEDGGQELLTQDECSILAQSHRPILKLFRIVRTQVSVNETITSHPFPYPRSHPTISPPNGWHIAYKQQHPLHPPSHAHTHTPIHSSWRLGSKTAMVKSPP